jgi:hypothetical protein
MNLATWQDKRKNYGHGVGREDEHEHESEETSDISRCTYGEGKIFMCNSFLHHCLGQLILYHSALITNKQDNHLSASSYEIHPGCQV